MVPNIPGQRDDKSVVKRLFKADWDGGGPEGRALEAATGGTDDDLCAEADRKMSGTDPRVLSCRTADGGLAFAGGAGVEDDSQSNLSSRVRGAERKTLSCLTVERSLCVLLAFAAAVAIVAETRHRHKLLPHERDIFEGLPLSRAIEGDSLPRASAMRYAAPRIRRH